MQKQLPYQKYLPHILIIAGFIIISCLFCLPAFQGNVMNQHDMFTWLYGSKESRDFYEQTGENALWMNNIFGGMPAVTSDFYPGTNWFHKLNQFIQFYTHGEVTNPAIYFILAMICFYILMMVMKVNPWLAAIGSIAFAFSSYNPIIISAGHTTKMLDIAFLPGIIAGVLWAYQGRYWAGAALAGLFMALFFDSGHYQIVYYGGILIGIIVIGKFFLAVKSKDYKTWMYASIALLLAAIFSSASNISRILQTQEYNPYSIRGGNNELESQSVQGTGLDRDYAFSWSNDVGETFCLLVPNLYGGSSGENIGPDSHFGKKLASFNVPFQQIDQITSAAPMYWGTQPMLSGPVYFGAVICFLAVFALFIIRNPMKWWIAGAALFFILLSLGKNFSTLNYFLFDHFPLFNKFRAPSMALSISSVLFPLLAIWALRDVFKGKIDQEEVIKKLKLSVGIVGGLCLVILISTYAFLDYRGPSDHQIQQSYAQSAQNEQLGLELITAIREDRQAMASKDAWRSLFFVLLTGGIIWGFVTRKLKKEMAFAGLGLAIMIDEIPVAKRYLNEHNFLDEYTYEMQFMPSAADQEILQDPDPYYRVFDITKSPFNDAKPSYFHKSIGGYHPAKLQIYQDLIERHIGSFNSAVLNMLNTKYLIVPGQNGQPMVQRNPNALGNAWFVNEIKWVKSAEEEITALNAPSLQNPSDFSRGNFNPSETAVIREDFKNQIQVSNLNKESGSIQLQSYAPNRLVFTTQNQEDGLAVFSDIYYPIGWTATIDGKEVPILRANYVLRALEIPKGTHEIEFYFRPDSFEIGERISLFGSITLTLLIGFGVFTEIRRRKTENKA